MLKDSYMRTHDYLRVSITDKCNLRCRYCMPPEGVELLPHDQVLRNEEFIRIIGLFVSMGVVKVRFTGGEPLDQEGPYRHTVRDGQALPRRRAVPDHERHTAGRPYR